MSGRTWQAWAVRGLVWAGLAAVAFAGAALRAAPPTALARAIPSQPLADALIRYAQETGLQLIYFSDVVTDQQSTEVPAGLAPQDALGRLLLGTGLQFQYVNARLIRITSAAHQGAAMAGREASAPAHAAAATTEEVVITAQRMGTGAENRMPISLAVWTEESMQLAGVRGTADIAAFTPGVEFDRFTDQGPGLATNIAIRGINMKTGSTVGLYMDDTPLPATSDWGDVQGFVYGRAFPLTFDLERVEVLYGPQGTLFGAGAAGGVIRYISKQPDLVAFSGQVHGEVSTTERGASSYEVGAAAGGPIEPGRIGFRLSAWYRDEGGFIDRVDPFTQAVVEANSNRSQSSLFRGALTFAPTDALLISPSLNYQDVRVHDSASIFMYLSDPAAGILHNGKLLRQPVEDRYYLASLKVSASLGQVQLTTVSSYFDRSLAALSDITNYPYGFGNPLGAEYPTAYGDAISKSTELREKAFSQEVRLSSEQPNAPLHWTVGLFYSHGKNRDEDNQVSGPIPPDSPADGFDGVEESQDQVAGFGTAALALGKHLTASAGVRITRFAYDSLQYAGGPANDGVPPEFRVSDVQRMVTPRFGLEYQVNDGNLLYGLVANGAEPGGFNVPAADCVYPNSFGPDSLWSYELGSKSTLFDGRAQLNVDLFHMHWHDKQIDGLYVGPNHRCAYTGNVGAAASDGFEASAQALIGSHLTAGLAVAYANARYTQTVRTDNVLTVKSGDAIGALPLVPSPWNLSATLNYRVRLGTATTAMVNVADYFRNRNPGPFYNYDPESPAYTPGRRPNPSINILNLRGALSWSQFELALYLDNALDARPTLLLRNLCGKCTLYYATGLRPRTLGLAGTWRF